MIETLQPHVLKNTHRLISCMQLVLGDDFCVKETHNWNVVSIRTGWARDSHRSNSKEF